MRLPKVYLAGPISGLTYEQCVGWREYAAGKLEQCGIECFSPMRHKNYLEKETKMADTYPQHLLSRDRAIMTRDHNDAITSDALLVNLLDADTRVTIGTVMELAWAWDRRIPVICVMKPGNIHDHAMVREAIGFRAETLDEGIACVRTVLRPN